VPGPFGRCSAPRAYGSLPGLGRRDGLPQHLTGCVELRGPPVEDALPVVERVERSGAGPHDARACGTGQHLADDAGGQPGRGKDADASHRGDVGIGVGATAVGQPFGPQQSRPLVVAQQPLAGPGPPAPRSARPPANIVFTVRLAIRELPTRTLFGSDAPNGDPVLSRTTVERVTPPGGIRERVPGGSLLELLRLV